jgi:hypothetical protein
VISGAPERTGGNVEQIIYNDTAVKQYKDTGFGPAVIHEYIVSRNCYLG